MFTVDYSFETRYNEILISLVTGKLRFIIVDKTKKEVEIEFFFSFAKINFPRKYFFRLTIFPLKVY